mmetsp:Transcript_14481/g.34669  ORF Transcript_14481/g.34669 Transcript_14481/m.34669 type:complete len:217 (+) Transcript_14481:340-990(+)
MSPKEYSPLPVNSATRPRTRLSTSFDKSPNSYVPSSFPQKFVTAFLTRLSTSLERSPVSYESFPVSSIVKSLLILSNASERSPSSYSSFSRRLAISSLMRESNSFEMSPTLYSSFPMKSEVFPLTSSMIAVRTNSVISIDSPIHSSSATRLPIFSFRSSTDMLFMAASASATASSPSVEDSYNWDDGAYLLRVLVEDEVEAYPRSAGRELADRPLS